MWPTSLVSAVTDREKDLVTVGIGSYGAQRAVARAHDLGLRSLDDTEGRFFAVGAAAERQNGLSQRAVHNEFIVNGIESHAMHGPAEECLLTF